MPPYRSRRKWESLNKKFRYTFLRAFNRLSFFLRKILHLNMFRKLRTVIYHVNDLQQAKAWYIKVTGIQPYFDESFYVGFNIYGCELGLDPATSEVKGGTQSVAYWLVDDIEESVKKLLAENAKIVAAITEVGEGIKVATIEDPFGNCIGLIEEKPTS